MNFLHDSLANKSFTYKCAGWILFVGVSVNFDPYLKAFISYKLICEILLAICGKVGYNEKNPECMSSLHLKLSTS